ncbi:S8 family peptidase [Breznakia pachnodae]|uniref:Subtilisin family serine protease n=1 Tax=Breznakia pachnodae TaxID=265178 RepID=A0ABU0E2N0_9FIRM|nr:S8 family serine peptidase [Breznakia pachnodae]MDQ0360981.1 subtilisin family serine protease [Breznakia pachnodae]
MRRKLTLVFLTFLLVSCSHTSADLSSNKLNPYEDVRGIFELKTLNENQYNAKDIFTYSFNKNTTFKGNELYAEQIMENGKNPGLDIKKLHDQNITGEGVNVAIIDQNMLLDHPEFKDKIVKYYDTGCNTKKDESSMHGPAVTSVLVGDSTGVAPNANVYYVAVPSWKLDSKYYADGIDWIIEQNQSLDKNQKIRVISISGAPSGDGSPFKENQELYNKAVQRANDEGIMILDCRSNETTGIIGPAYSSSNSPDDISSYKAGFPTDEQEIYWDNFIFTPCSYRTLAEEYKEGVHSFQYYGQGGLSWGIPYAAGVLALGWQINPELSNEEIIETLKETSYINDIGNRIIYPEAFINSIKNSINN